MESLSIVEARNLSFGLLNQASLAVRPQDRLTLSGPSGSGKSLFLRMLALLMRPDSGEILYRGEPVMDEDVPFFRSRVIYVPQSPVFFPGTVEENLRRMFELRVHQNRRFSDERSMMLLSAIGRKRDFLTKDSRLLSGGEAQIASLLRALQLEPEILCLDEPTSALDADTAIATEAWLLREFSGALVWVSHDDRQLQRIGGRRFLLRSGAWSHTP